MTCTMCSRPVRGKPHHTGVCPNCRPSVAAVTVTQPAEREQAERETIERIRTYCRQRSLEFCLSYSGVLDGAEQLPPRPERYAKRSEVYASGHSPQEAAQLAVARLRSRLATAGYSNIIKPEQEAVLTGYVKRCERKRLPKRSYRQHWLRIYYQVATN